MGAFISYLHLAHGINNFFVLAPNLTIYNKLITDFSDRTHPKYVFKGIAEFAIDAPSIITGDNYDQHDPASGTLFGGVRINIFNISKINSEVRGGKAPRIKRLSEYIGESYFDYLAGLPDLVMLMDESHRYRASAGIRAINELKPILGLELTATPFVEDRKGCGAVQECDRGLPAGQGDGGWLCEGACRGDAQEFQSGGDVAGRDRAHEAGRRRAPAREREGGAGDLRPRNRVTRSSNLSCW